MTSLVIRGGTVVTETDIVEADLLVQGDRIAAIGGDQHGHDELDASGCFVIPGGIDIHTHIDLDYRGTTTCDDFTSGTISAAAGGTTSIVDFCTQAEGEAPTAAVARWHEKLRRAKPVADVGFHLAVTDLSKPEYVDELRHMPSLGVTSFKLYMSYTGTYRVDDETLFRAMRAAGESGALLMVHAENGGVVDVLVEEALARGDCGPAGHASAHPAEVEVEAVTRATLLAELAGCELYVVHVSSGATVRVLREARKRGARVHAETCTHYLVLDQDLLAHSDGEKYVISPPVRGAADREALWDALADDTLSIVSSDHAPYHWPSQKLTDGKDFRAIRSGVPGVEDRMPVLYSNGVAAGRIDLRRFVEVTAANPARVFGLYPRKGVIAVGSDADLVVLDPRSRGVRSAATHASRVNYNLYEGLDIDCTISAVLVRGTVVMSGGSLLVEPGHGRFLHRTARAG